MPSAIPIRSISGSTPTARVKHGVTEDQLVDLIRKHFKLTPKGIIESLNLRRPIYKESARDGHFGRELPNFTWEKTDKADAAAQRSRQTGPGPCVIGLTNPSQPPYEETSRCLSRGFCWLGP